MNNPLTLQEIFDQCCQHLAAQKRRSEARDKDGDMGCLYRGADGCKCGYGAFIPDDEYRPEMETQTVTGLQYGTLRYVAPAFRDEPGRWASEEHKNLAFQIQRAHDARDNRKPPLPVQALRLRLTNIAAQFGLNPSAALTIREWCGDVVQV